MRCALVAPLRRKGFKVDVAVLSVLSWEAVHEQYDRVLKCVNAEVCKSDWGAENLRRWYELIPQRIAAEASENRTVCDIPNWMFRSRRIVASGISSTLNFMYGGLDTRGMNQTLVTESLKRLPAEQLEVLKCNYLTMMKYCESLLANGCNLAEHVRDVDQRLLGWIFDYLEEMCDPGVKCSAQPCGELDRNTVLPLYPYFMGYSAAFLGVITAGTVAYQFYKYCKRARQVSLQRQQLGGAAQSSTTIADDDDVSVATVVEYHVLDARLTDSPDDTTARRGRPSGEYSP